MASQQLPPPGHFRIHDECLSELWTAWKDCWVSYATATKLYDENGAVRVSVFLTVIGPEAHAVFCTLTWDSPADKQDLEKVINVFDAYEPRRDIAYERFGSTCGGRKMARLWSSILPRCNTSACGALSRTRSTRSCGTGSFLAFEHPRFASGFCTKQI